MLATLSLLGEHQVVVAEVQQDGTVVERQVLIALSQDYGIGIQPPIVAPLDRPLVFALPAEGIHPQRFGPTALGRSERSYRGSPLATSSRHLDRRARRPWRPPIVAPLRGDSRRHYQTEGRSTCGRWGNVS